MPAAKTRIFLADDYPLVRRGVRALLETCPDWEVCGEAATGPQAVELVQKLNPNIVILDISMPRADWLKDIRQIHKLGPEVEILILSMHDSPPIVHGALQAGARGYVLKSDSDLLVMQAVQAVSEHRPYLSPSISADIMDVLIKAKKRLPLAPKDGSCLTPRQCEILTFLAKGKHNKEVACALGISTRTVEVHRQRIMTRLKAQTVSDLVLFALRQHLIEL